MELPRHCQGKKERKLLNLAIFSMVFATLWVATTTSFAAEEMSSDVWASYTRAEDNSLAYLLDLNIGIGLDDALLLGMSRSESDLLGETIETNSYLLGYNSFRLAPWATNVFYEYWGKRRELVIESLGVELNYFGAAWNADVAFEYREIDFYTRELMIGQRRFNANSVGLGLGLGLSRGQLDWSLNAKWYDYSKDIQRLNTARGVFILGLKNVNRISSLNEWTAVTKLYYRFDDIGLGLSYSYAVAELDGASSAMFAALFDMDITRVVSAEAEMGQIYEGQGITTDYVLFGLGFHF